MDHWDAGVRAAQPGGRGEGTVIDLHVTDAAGTGLAAADVDGTAVLRRAGVTGGCRSCWALTVPMTWSLTGSSGTGRVGGASG